MYQAILRSIATTALLLIISLPLIGCNTMEGLGKDIQAAGRVLENTADRDN